MAKLSLIVNPDSLHVVNSRLIELNLSKAEAAKKIGISRSTLTNFFLGSPVSPSIFLRICEEIGVDWETVAFKIHKAFRIQNPAARPKSSKSAFDHIQGYRCLQEAFDRIQGYRCLQEAVDRQWSLKLDLIAELLDEELGDRCESFAIAGFRFEPDGDRWKVSKKQTKNGDVYE